MSPVTPPEWAAMPAGWNEKILVEPNAVLSLASGLIVTGVFSDVDAESGTVCGAGNCTTGGGSVTPCSTSSVLTLCCCTTGVTSSFGTNALEILPVVPSGLVTVTTEPAGGFGSNTRSVMRADSPGARKIV